MELNITEANRSFISVRKGMKEQFAYDVKIRYDRNKTHYNEIIAEIQAIMTDLRKKFPSKNGNGQ